jgi:hypothetical protein
VLTPDKVIVAEGTVNMKEQQNRGAYEMENEEEPTTEAKVLVDRIWEMGEGGSLDHIPPFEPGQVHGNSQLATRHSRGESRFSSRDSREREFIEEFDEAKLPPALYLTIPKGSPRDTLERIREVLLAHPGGVSVVCRVQTNGEWREITAKTKVELNEHLQSSLTKVLGDHHVNVR